jgi:phosphatidylglycerol---prolipoprotein diacylglyceryl transferase
MPLAAIAYPSLDPVAFRLGPLAVHWYGLAYLFAFVGAALIARWLIRRWTLAISDDDLLTILLAAILGVIAGGRLGYVLVYGDGYYLRNPGEILAVWDGGMSFHGGLLGIMIAGVIVAKMLDMPFLTLWDMGAVGAPVGFLLGRFANFVNGELWGRVSDVPWAMVFPTGGPLPRHPSQLYEAVLEGVVLLTVMLFLSAKRPPRPRGELVGWVLALYGALRVFSEFFREPDSQLGFISGGWLTMGMLLSAPMVVGGVALVVWARRRGLPQAGRAAIR